MNKQLTNIKIKEIITKHKELNSKNMQFEILNDIAKLRGGKIKKGEIYTNNRTKMIFIDKLDNEFKITPSDVKGGHWSSYEAGVMNDPNYHMKKLEEIALSKGGKIKEGEIYINYKTPIIFIDKAFNEFKMKPQLVKRGSWSPYESGNIYNNPDYHMKELERIALLKGGRIKEGEIYTNNRTKMIFIDKLGNEFEMSSNAVKRGQWSPYECKRNNNPDYHMKELERIALLKGGKIKEDQKYVNNTTKMTFIDQLGNEFEMTPDAIKRGTWSCFEKNYSENICRQIIEQIYKNKFPSVWNILQRKNGNRMQLDGYCKKLNIAFEYQGIQHNVGWKRDMESLKQIQERDQEKKQLCKEKNILLIEVHDYKIVNNHKIIIEKTIEDIKKSYKVHVQKIPNFILNLKVEEIKIDLSKINHLVLMQKELEEIAVSKGGKIKEGERYIHSKVKMTFIDNMGNEFKMSPNSIKRGGWSPYVSGHVFHDPDYHMAQLKKIAASKGGKIKNGQHYVSSTTEMIFIDKLGNQFNRKPGDVKSGLWSPYETKNTKDIQIHMKELKKIAEAKGGKIKEGEIYISSGTKMTFIDKLGNEFKAAPTRVKNGKWSPYECKNPMDKEYHLKMLQQIATSKGGKIKEGEIYIDNKVKMTFIDKNGREFKMTPNNVKNGKWSPYEYEKSKDKDVCMNKIKGNILFLGYTIKEGEIYVNSKTKITLVDRDGNEFKMTPNQIKSKYNS